MILVSKSQIKNITSLLQKKYRTKLGLFIAEGPKVINELLVSGFTLHELFTTNRELFQTDKAQIVSEKDLKKISFLKNANSAVAVFKIPPPKPIVAQGITVVLDAIRDPGNLGTIIRLCDWFGVQQLVCSQDTVDCYNPKVIQATMGSITRVAVSYTDISIYLTENKTPIYATCMDGEVIYQSKLPKNAIIVLGNEANGISDKIIALASHKVSIPQFGEIQETESLNVATATAIILSEFKRATGL